MNLFNNKLYVLLDKITNLFLLNIIFILACAPIVTIFPAVTAMISVVRQWKIKDETAVIKPFIDQFKNNFKSSFLLGLLWIPFSILLYIDFFLLMSISSGLKTFLWVFYFLIVLTYLFMSSFLVPILVHYDMRLRDVLKNSFLTSLIYFPTTLLILMISAVSILVLYLLPPVCLIIFSVWANIIFTLTNRAFQKIERFKADAADLSNG